MARRTHVGSHERAVKLRPGAHGLPRAEVARIQRERMLTAAFSTLSELGYAGASVTAILKRAQISRRTFYEQFADRDDCLVVAYDRANEELLRAFADGYHSVEAWPAQIREGLRGLLGLLAVEPAYARVCIVEVLAGSARVLTRRDALTKRLGVFFDTGRQQASGGPPLPSVVTTAVVESIHGILHAHIRHGPVERLPRLLPDLVYISLAPYLGAEEALREMSSTDAG